MRVVPQVTIKTALPKNRLIRTIPVLQIVGNFPVRLTFPTGAIDANMQNLPVVASGGTVGSGCADSNAPINWETCNVYRDLPDCRSLGDGSDYGDWSEIPVLRDIMMKPTLTSITARTVREAATHLEKLGITTTDDLDRIRGEYFMSRYGLLKNLVGENAADSILHNLSINQCCKAI